MIETSDLFTTRVEITALEKEIGIGDFLEVDKAIYAFIASHEAPYIDLIYTHHYFKKTSLSTIKRSVASLEEKGLIERRPNAHVDRRVVVYKACE